VDSFLSLLVDRVRICAGKSKRRDVGPRALPTMPWWSQELWTLRKELWVTYRTHASNPTPENRRLYKICKTTYQRELRSKKMSSWKDFCTRNLGGNLFDEIDKLANPRVSQDLPSTLVVNDVVYTEQSEILQ